MSRTWARLRRSIAIAIVGGTVVGGSYIVATPGAQAATTIPDSSVTVAWGTGDITVGPDAAATAAEVKAVNPDHQKLTSDGKGGDVGSGHWEDFKNLKVTVSQTKGLRDQAITVSVAGLETTEVTPGEGVRNYVQAMQCWGPDPSSEDFAKTCQWGAFASTEVGGDPPTSLTAVFGNFVDYTVNRGGVRFRARQGAENTDKPRVYGGFYRGLSEFFTASTSNEVPLIAVGADGRGSAAFVTQTAAAQPYLGCGAPGAERCWLVLVPRGSHSGTRQGDANATCSEIAARAGDLFGRKSLTQDGSPLSPQCSFWQDRIVVPLDFDNPFTSCKSGAAERRIIGSELLSAAMSSWQSALCATTSVPYSLATNSGNLARAQLLQGQAGMAVVSRPVTASTIGAADPALLDGTDVRHAPVANTAVAIGFIGEQQDMSIISTLKLTPRLVAKLLTQSYQAMVPSEAAKFDQTQGKSKPFLRFEEITLDPEWIALGNPTKLSGATRGIWLSVGPQGDDAMALLWRYVLADADARAFLNGAPDPWGATVNRYYLPPGAKDAAGGGTDLLSAPLETMPKADQTLFPSVEDAKERTRGLQVDSVGYVPYSGSFHANASRITRVDTQLTNTWDPNKANSANENGGWATNPPYVQGSTSGRLTTGLVTAPDADLYHLGTAELALPLSTVTTAENVASSREFVALSDASVAAAIAAAPADATTGVAQPDPARVGSGQYPLSTTLYGAVNLAGTATANTRAEYADFIDYAAGAGNVRGLARGKLPAGYVPLTASQTDAARAVATELRSGANSPSGEAPTDDRRSVGSTSAAAAAAASSAPGGSAPQVTATAIDAAPSPTAVTTASSVGSVAVGGGLIAGLAGLVLAPFLLRRRESG